MEVVTETSIIREMERVYKTMQYSVRPSAIYICLIRYSRKWKGRRFVYLHHPLFDMAKRS